MICRGRHFRPLVTGPPRPLPRPSPAASAVVPRDHCRLRSSHLPLSGTGADLSANRGRKPHTLPGRPQGDPSVPRGGGEARPLGGAFPSGYAPRAARWRWVSGSDSGLCPLSSASSVPDAGVSREGPSVPVAGAWPRTTGPPFADWQSAPVTPPKATPRRRAKVSGNAG